MNNSWQIVDRLRREKGLSLKQLANLCGVSGPAVQQWKHGGGITLECLKKIAAYFGTTVDEIITVHNPGLAAHASGFTPATKPVRSSMAVLRDGATPAYGTPSAAPPQPLCRFPADCDLSRDLSQMQTQLSTLSTQVETLTRLLGATLAASANGVAHDKQKAG